MNAERGFKSKIGVRIEFDEVVDWEKWYEKRTKKFSG